MADKPIVYFTRDISPAGLLKVYRALGWTPAGKVGVKLSTGEPPASHYLDPRLIADLVHEVNGTIVECNTAYGGPRSSTAKHRKVAAEHGFTAIADVDIQDADGDRALPVPGGRWLKENYVGTHFFDYDSYLVLSHFKGHVMAGLGGAVKNISIGFASSRGKSWIHSSGGHRGAGQDSFLESMAEAALSVARHMGSRICYVNVMNNLSVDCDCDGHAAPPDMADIGVLASLDPVAVDRACVDLVYAAPDGRSLIRRMESRNGPHTLDYGAAIGLGSLTYTLQEI